MLGGKSIALNAYIRKQEMSEIYDHFNKLEKEKQNTWGKKIIKNRNKQEMKSKELRGSNKRSNFQIRKWRE